jgi:hypothetical protein
MLRVMLACIGHWYVGGLYLAPVAILVGVLKLSAFRERRGGGSGPAQSA